MKIGVLLLQNRIDIFKNVVIVIVFIAGNYDAYRKLFIEIFVWNRVFLLIIRYLFINEHIDVLLLLNALVLNICAIFSINI